MKSLLILLLIGYKFIIGKEKEYKCGWLWTGSIILVRLKIIIFYDAKTSLLNALGTSSVATFQHNYTILNFVH